MTVHQLLRSFWAACLLALALAPAVAQELVPVPPLTGRVVDQTSTLTPADVAAIDAQLGQIEQTHGSQVVVLIVATTQPEDIASYAQRVGDDWKVGRKDVGDGLILVVAKNDRTVRIQVAKALQGAVPDLAASIIINDRIVPAFAQGDFAGGLKAGIERIGERIGTEGLPEPTRTPSKGKDGFGIADLGVFLLLGVPVIGSILRAIFGRTMSSLISGGIVAAAGWWLTTSLVVGIGAGLIALVVVLLGIGTRNGIPMILTGGLGGGGGGGGWSSGGGGNFDGGGASGRW